MLRVVLIVLGCLSAFTALVDLVVDHEVSIVSIVLSAASFILAWQDHRRIHREA